jgi:hypothetical protein
MNRFLTRKPGVPEGERASLSGIQKMVQEDLLERDLTEEDITRSLNELTQHRNLMTKGARATNVAAAQDLKNVMLRLDTEVRPIYPTI